MFIVSVMVLYVCPTFYTWLECYELLLLFLIAYICSLYLVWNILPVCPMYFNGQYRHFIRQMSLLLYLSVRGWFYYVLYCVLRSECYFICIPFNNLLIFLVSFPLYIKVAHIFRCCESMSVFCFCGAGCFMTLFLL
jgi:hypothetical protein